MEFSKEEFMTLAIFAACNDRPEDTEDISINDLNSILDKIASDISGFSSWIDFYLHLMTESK